MNILVLCTGNSCRSQMAHGFLAEMLPQHTVYSAGTETHGVNPKAIQVLAEKGIDISQHTSNNVDEYLSVPFDLVFTVCDNAKEACPVLPGNHETIHHSFKDPGKAQGTEDEVLNEFREVRDEIQAYCVDLVRRYS